LIPDTVKSFSQFPPSVYRKSLAAKTIQRAWRRHRGRVLRKKLKSEQHDAAVKIQRMARRKLRKIRETKNISAAKIQKCWRRRVLIWVALLRCIYQSPIRELHHSATVIQRKWRHWRTFKNSPFADKYRHKMEDLIEAANKIRRWWLPLASKMTVIRNGRKRQESAAAIQRLWRGTRDDIGYSLRKHIRADIRKKLKEVGARMLKFRYST
jgi:hypothetical protein